MLWRLAFRRGHGPGFVETLPVKKFHGVGPATAERMRKYGIETALDLKSKSLAFLKEHFGKSGAYFYGIARGIDERQVRPDRIRKSVGAEDTFAEDINDLEGATAELKPLAEKVWRYCEARGIGGKTVTKSRKGLRREQRSNRLIRWISTQKRPRLQRALRTLRQNAVRLARDRCAGNAADVGSVDAEVLQFAAGHAAEFGDGLMELAPVVERACYVHDNPLPEGYVTSATLFSSGVVSMTAT